MKFVEDNKMLSSTFVFTAEPKPLEYVSHAQAELINCYNFIVHLL